MRKNKSKLTFALPLWTFLLIAISLVTSISIVIIVVATFNLVEKEYVQNNIFLFLIICFSSVMIVGTILAFIMTRILKYKFKKVTVVFKKIADGDFSSKIKLPSPKSFLYHLIYDFNKMVDRLKSTALLQSNFADNFSHEFKTPIASIKGYAEILKTNKNLSKEETETYLKIIIDETDRLIKLSSSTLLLSELDSKTSFDNITEVKINEQIEDCVLLLDNSFQEKNIDVELSLTPFKIKTNKEMLSDVWINILSNAVKYNVQNGKIKIRSYINKKGYVVEFEDTGIGMDEKTKTRVFDKYFQGESHAKKGNGLGLSIVKKIIELAGGEITVSSELNKGSIFTIIFPTE